ncbi:hypothetical protein F5Y04DRAFT_207766 [Hypomontagnella monticulosa]|nr:hypothetical protein F5Y04DRAFT_207766 [Hypomontagnella monticulosa]
MGSFEPLMSFNLPELLAVDLEESEEVFKSRQLTAGAPSPQLVDDGSKRRYSLQDSSMSAIPSSHHLDMMSRAKSLQNVHEKQAQLITIHHELHRTNSDSGSASSESSGGLMPPSIGTRDASIATTATSVTSERIEPGQLKLVIQDKKQAGHSWMDLDAEDATSPDRRHNSMVNIPSPAQFLALRHIQDESRSMSLNSAVPRPKLTGSPAMSPTSVRSFGAEKNHVKKPLASPTTIPKRRSSLKYQNYPSLPQINVSPSLQSPTMNPLSTQSDGAPLSPAIDMTLPGPLRLSNSETYANYAGCEGDDIGAGLPSPESRSRKAEAERLSQADGSQYPEIAPLGIDVESWLESSVDNFPYYAQTKGDGGHAPLPLPPDVIDTLRVSISCFPETMLQCSSLSIETIRSHSRKLRYKASSPASLYSESPASVDSSEQSKKSGWKWLPLKRQPSSPQTPPSPQRSGFGESLDSRYSPSWPRKPDWTAIQNLFPAGSDYLCDALYAHLVAYNYITSLCPRSALVNPTTSRPSSKSSTAPSIISLGLSIDLRTSMDMRPSSDGTSIPTKAASLLGLQDNPNAPIPEPPSSRCNTLRSKRSFFVMPRSASYNDSRPTTATGGFSTRRPPPPDQSEVLRDLRLGLARCLSRLVATLRMTNAGPDGAEQAKREEDPDFMRALCEIVRLSEERYM